MKTVTAIELVRSGCLMMAEHDEEGGLKYRVGGRGVTPPQARSIIKTLSLIPNHDTLFEEVESQSWRLPDSG